MNILIFNSVFFAKSQTFIYQQVKGLSKTHTVSLLGFNFENDEFFPTDARKHHVKFYSNLFDRFFSALIRKIRNNYSSIGYISKRKIVNILSHNRTDVIHAHFGPGALLILPIAKALNIPLIVTFHGVDASPAYLKRAKYRSDLPELFDYAKAIIIVSPHMLETLAIDSWRQKVHVIPCCVDSEYFKRQGIKQRASDIEIIHSGRLTPKKGVPDLIRVFIQLSSRHSNIKLIIIGEGEDKELCQSLANQSIYKNKIVFAGSQSQADVCLAMQNADIFVLNSRTDSLGDMEGSPVSILEAMSLEMPVVSTYHAGIPNVITDQLNGLLVPENDNEALEFAIEKLINSEADRIELGLKARQRILSDFTNDIMLKKINSIL
jgi:colanic acid/amylovoran biosynthesis glycosyltransferase